MWDYRTEDRVTISKHGSHADQIIILRQLKRGIFCQLWEDYITMLFYTMKLEAGRQNMRDWRNRNETSLSNAQWHGWEQKLIHSMNVSWKESGKDIFFCVCHWTSSKNGIFATSAYFYLEIKIGSNCRSVNIKNRLNCNNLIWLRLRASPAHILCFKFFGF